MLVEFYLSTVRLSRWNRINLKINKTIGENAYALSDGLLFFPCVACDLFKLGKLLFCLKLLCLCFILRMPLFYFNYKIYWSLLILCCHCITFINICVRFYFTCIASFFERRYTQYWFMLTPSLCECSANALCKLRGILSLNCPE